MEPRDEPFESASSGSRGVESDGSPLHEDDPELEREFRELAQWLLDVYLWKLHEERKGRGSSEVDNHPPPTRI